MSEVNQFLIGVKPSAWHVWPQLVHWPFTRLQDYILDGGTWLHSLAQWGLWLWSLFLYTPLSRCVGPAMNWELVHGSPSLLRPLLIAQDARQPVWQTSRWLRKAHSLPFIFFHFFFFFLCVFDFFVCYVRHLFIHFYCNSMSQTLQVVCKVWVNQPYGLMQIPRRNNQMVNNGWDSF